MKRIIRNTLILVVILLILPIILLPFLAGKPSGKPLGKQANALVQKAFMDLDGPWVDYHAHLIGMGTNDLFVNPKMMTIKNPYQYYRFLAYKRASGISDIKNGNQQYVERLKQLIVQFPKPGQTHLLAFDKFFDPDGTYREDETEFFVSNHYTQLIVEQNKDYFRTTVSINPYRHDAIEEIKKWHQKGARIVKWLPNAMGMDPDDPKLIPFYQTIKDLNMAIITHVGYEMAVESAEHQAYGNPLKWRSALNLGTKIIFAHVGSLGQCEDLESPNKENVDCFDLAIRLLSEKAYENNLFADISATIFINRKVKVMQTLLKREDLHPRLMNGSDYPIPAINAMISTRLFQHRGYLNKQEAKLLREIYDHNPLLFDFVLKRTLHLPNTQTRLPASIFMENKKLFG